MGRSARKLRSTIYENDVISFDALDEIENIAPLKTNKAIKKAVKKPTEKQIEKKSSIKTNPVEATCNKCSGKVVGELVADIYLPFADKVMPLITYTCESCGHVGRRSVLALALPLVQYERKFFN
jgi:hypothetical protein